MNPGTETLTTIDRDTLLRWLQETDPVRLEELWAAADRVRRANVGDEVHLRGLVEFSNHCVRRCAYCGIRAGSPDVTRYRMTREEILECARQIESFDYGTIVLQSGEDLGLDAEWVAGVIREIRDVTDLAVTISLGERPEDDYRLWRDAGADRFLLRFETTDPELFARIHPGFPGRLPRLEILKLLRTLGYEVGSGVMIGIPGQRWSSLAADLEMFRELDLDMIGVGPYIPHPDTPLGKEGNPDFPPAPAGEQVPNSELMTYKVVALTRLIRPDANIPSTTALATLNTASGRELGLSRGANIVMPNVTPPEYRKYYEIYPDKACLQESAGQCHICMGGRIHSIGRLPGKGKGGRGSGAVLREDGPVS